MVKVHMRFTVEEEFLQRSSTFLIAQDKVCRLICRERQEASYDTSVTVSKMDGCWFRSRFPLHWLQREASLHLGMTNEKM